MHKDPLVWVGVVTLGVAVWLIAPFVIPARAPVIAEESISEIRYVCTETGELFTRRLTAATLPHPTTGKPTLVPAVYDAKRKKWKPGPPLEVMQRQGLLRPAS
jgi:hypothetical protein